MRNIFENKLCGQSLGSLLGGENIMEEVLKKEGDHGVGGDPAVVGGQSHPQPGHTFPRDTLLEAIDESVIGLNPVGACIISHLPSFIFMILVFTLSKGREKTAVATPEIADPISLVDMLYFF